jgi:hypothetical protein
MSTDTEPQNPFLADEQPAGTTTAAEKIGRTLREMSRPDEDAGEMELTLATVAMGLERGLGAELERAQGTGELDEFVLALTRWIALHRSDSADRLVVVELPSYTVHPELGRGREPRARTNLPAGTRLKVLDDAIAAAETASSPL